MFALVPTTFLEWAICLGLFAAGFILFFAGNLLFGWKAGGKRLVIFAAGMSLSLLGGLALRELCSMGDASIFLVVLVALLLTIGLSLLVAAFASDERVEKIFKILLGSL